METANIRVNIEGFRAINKANIIIDGITVVAGENGCGKSSIAKLLYYFYRTVSNYDEFVHKELRYNLSDVMRFLELIRREFLFRKDNRNSREQLRRESGREFAIFRNGLNKSETLTEELELWIRVINDFEQNYDLFEKDNKISSRIILTLQDLLKTDSKDNLETLFGKLKELVISKFKEAEGKIESRPVSIFSNELKSAFSDSNLPKRFDVFEYDALMVSLNKNHISIPYNVQNAIYIDTPVILDIQSSDNEHWDDLNELISEKGKSTNEFSEFISKEIIHGNALVDDDDLATDQFQFKRDDGALFRLLDVATGVKAFSILQLLLNKGIINSKTLLLIDEPESHLHPQWIIEYARLIVLLNKKYGVKFLIASHNPDMVSAIRYISEKEDTLNKLNYYLAEKTGSYTYDYRHLGIEIDPIFGSFNIALNRMNEYGSSES